MAAKKKSKKVTKSKRTAGKKSTRAKRVPKKRAAAKRTAAKKKSAANSRKALATRRSARKRAVRRVAEQNATVDLGGLQSRSGLQSGDLQGVRDVESANSESVEELLEEGNAFEAGIVAGIEKAEDDIEKEIRTHEVPEDDVPEEYLDKD
jgi:hypothetical protein